MKDDCDVNGDPVSRYGAEAPSLALDWAYLARQTLGDADLECELLCAFRDQAESILRRLRGVQPMAARERADFAHLLKGSARAIGAIRVGLACETYEARLADCGSAALADFGPAAEDALRDLAAAVAEATDAIDRSLAKRSL